MIPARDGYPSMAKHGAAISKVRDSIRFTPSTYSGSHGAISTLKRRYTGNERRSKRLDS